MGVPSAGETLEYIDMYLKEDVKQKAVRDAFANEFLKCACHFVATGSYITQCPRAGPQRQHSHSIGMP